MAKKPFAWDSEEVLGVIERNEKEKREVKLCTLKGIKYVQITTLALIKDEWKPTKGYTIPADVYKEMKKLIGNKLK